MSWGPTRGQHTWSRRGPYDDNNDRYDESDDDSWGQWKTKWYEPGSTWAHESNTWDDTSNDQSWNDQSWNDQSWNATSWTRECDWQNWDDTDAATKAQVVSTEVDLEQVDAAAPAAPQASNQPCQAKYSLVEHVKSMAAQAAKLELIPKPTNVVKKAWIRPYVPGLVDPINPKFMDETSASHPKASTSTKPGTDSPQKIQAVCTEPKQKPKRYVITPPAEEDMTDLDRILWQRPKQDSTVDG